MNPTKYDFLLLRDNTKRKFLALSLGVLAALLFLVLGELIARVYLNFKDSKPVTHTFRFKPKTIRESEEKIGDFGILPPTPLSFVEERIEHVYSRPFSGAVYSIEGEGEEVWISPKFSRPTGKLRAKFEVGGKLIYDVTYNLDEYGRRITPGEKEKKKVERFLILLGDSNVFGDGLNDEETISYFLGKQNPSVRVYNYGVSGLHPGEALEWLRNIKGAPEVSENKGTILYFWFDYYFRRSILSLSELSWAVGKEYYYERKDGEIVAEKSIREIWPLWCFLAKIYDSFALLKALNFDWPNDPKPEDFEFLAKVISRTEKEGKRLGADQFYIVFYPMKNPRYGQRLMSYLERFGVRYVDYSEFSTWNLIQGKAQIPFDGHFTGESNEAFAHELSRLKFLFEDAQASH